MSTQNILYIDSRFRTSVTDSDSDFKFQLPRTLSLESAHFRIDHMVFVNTFYTIEKFSCNIYFPKAAAPHYEVYTIPLGTYNGQDFAGIFQSVTGRTATYNSSTNSMTINDPTLLTEAQVIALGVAIPNSVNGILGHGDQIFDANFPALPSTSVQNGSNLTFPFLNLQCYDSVYLRSHALSCSGSRGACKQPHDILLKIPMTTGCGQIVEAATSHSIFLELPNRLNLNTLDFRLTDIAGNPVNLRQQ